VEYSLPGRVDIGGKVTARDIIIATGSVPFVPPGARSWLTLTLNLTLALSPTLTLTLTLTLVDLRSYRY